METKLKTLLQAIAETAAIYNIQPPQLIAVSKTKPSKQIEQAIGCGQINFGENYAQETLRKWPDLKQQYPQTKLHFLGKLQSNKVRTIAPLCDAIHTLDRDSLIKELVKLGSACPDLYIQINIGYEPQKGGITPDDLPKFLDACKEHSLPVVGLMAIPPANQNPDPFFKAMQKLQIQYNLPRLSMGMSSDWQTAIKYGATDIRIGTAIFGARD